MAGMSQQWKHAAPKGVAGGSEVREAEDAWQKPEDPWKIVGSSLRVNKGKLSNANVSSKGVVNEEGRRKREGEGDSKRCTHSGEQSAQNTFQLSNLSVLGGPRRQAKRLKAHWK